MNRLIVVLGVMGAYLLTGIFAHAALPTDHLDSLRSTRPTFAIPAHDELLSTIYHLKSDNSNHCMHLALYALERKDEFELSPTDIDELHYAVAVALQNLKGTRSAISYLQQLNPQANTLLETHLKFFEALRYVSDQKSDTLEIIMTDVINRYETYDHYNYARAVATLAIPPSRTKKNQEAIEQYKKAIASIDHFHYYESQKALFNYLSFLIRSIRYDNKTELIPKATDLISTLEQHLDDGNSKKYKFELNRYKTTYQLLNNDPKGALQTLSIVKDIIAEEPPFIEDHHRLHYHRELADANNRPQIANYEKAWKHGQIMERYMTAYAANPPLVFLMLNYQLLAEININRGNIELAKHYLDKTKETIANQQENLAKTELESKRLELAIQKKQLAQETLASKNSILKISSTIAAIGLLVSILLGLWLRGLYKKNRQHLAEIQSLYEDLTDKATLIEERNQSLESINQNLEFISQRRSKLINRLKNFAFVIMHDFKEPIRTVGAYSSLLSIRLRGNLQEDDKEHLNYLNKSAKRLNKMLELVQQFNLSNISLCKEYEIVSLNGVINEVYQDMEKEFEREDVSLSVEANLPNIVGQKNLLIQLFENLFQHSMHYRREGERLRISIRCEKNNSQICIMLKDNGRGFEEKQSNDLLSLFNANENYNLEEITVGLAMCKEILDIHEGNMAIEGYENQGTLITLYFPTIEDSMMRHDYNLTLDNKL